MLIVGAGPVGAILALELAHHSVPCTVVERSPEPPRHPGVITLDGRSMELLRRLGLASRLRDDCRVVGPAGGVVWTRGLDHPPAGMWPAPQEPAADAVDGTAALETGLLVRGAALSAFLRAALRRNPLIDLREGWTFTDLRVEGDRVLATVLEQRTGVRHALEAAHLAGCDGARSTVRRYLGIGLDRIGTPARRCAVLFRSSDAVLAAHAEAASEIVAGEATLTWQGDGDAWVGTVPLDEGPPAAVDPAEVLRDRLGLDGTYDVLAVSEWDESPAVASRYVRGRAYLAGAAAHRLRTAVGRRAGTDVADAVDLGWKLAATVRGWGGPRLAESYETERRHAALIDRELHDLAVQTRLRFGRLARAGASRELLAGFVAQEAHQAGDAGITFGRRLAGSPVVCHEPGSPGDLPWDRITPSTWPGSRAPAVPLADGAPLFDRLGPELTLVDLGSGGAGRALAERARRRGMPMTHLIATGVAWDRRYVLVRPDHLVAWRGDAPPADWTAVLDTVTGHISREHVMSGDPFAGETRSTPLTTERTE
ncbi:2-polyprenyl-6-methoxyphenol hydroxylase-like FAD-dependent oxidoreductase [Catenuloplanes nepalensis]|uniref:2-polyprenyl-6-methoxyphenol hydroxylase-like FAD-dependent oxidoreductase n=1 Tax=Catenuloplanes nepalensis TaxID=587533 RepID=A0ABT9MZE7_9ACTN|nr:FAD-dependent monooxygenase [Catenuloplanes nepalensis]MDP9796401.1 2-polyprenyl-6-methoxyphenol hydroxylase-like FAD-dependent oxidoreductase [Catenuloplanes nepalensis]